MVAMTTHKSYRILPRFTCECSEHALISRLIWSPTETNTLAAQTKKQCMTPNMQLCKSVELIKNLVETWTLMRFFTWKLEMIRTPTPEMWVFERHRINFWSHHCKRELVAKTKQFWQSNRAAKLHVKDCNLCCTELNNYPWTMSLRRNARPHKNAELGIKLHTPHSIRCTEQVNFDLIIGYKPQLLVTSPLEHKHISAYFYRSKWDAQKSNQSPELSTKLGRCWNKFSVTRKCIRCLKRHFGGAKDWCCRNSTGKRIKWKRSVEPRPFSHQLWGFVCVWNRNE